MLLAVHSYFSLRYGMLSIEDIMEAAKAYDIKSLALTDINNSTGILDFVKQAFKNNIKPIAGVEFRNGDHLLYVCIAKNNEGFSEINHFLTQHNLSKTDLPEKAPDFYNVFVIYPFSLLVNHKLKEYEFIGIRISELGKLFTSKYRKYQSKLVIYQPFTFHSKEDYIIHRHLRAIDKNILLSQLEDKQTAASDEIFYSSDDLRKAFMGHPEIIRNTEQLAATCSFEFDFGSLKNKKYFTESKEIDEKVLEKFAMEGFRERYGESNNEAEKRVKNELEVIFKLNFTAYFLIAHDIVSYTMQNGIYHVGRGSGANSIVAYCLKITDVDPIELNLYFERFLNPKRTSPPDFDIDYSWKDRDFVQQYIFNQYGKEFTALMGTMSTFKGKSIYRELGKIYGLPKNEIDQLIKYPTAVQNKNHLTEKIIKVAAKLVDYPNLRSIHAGGILISEKPLSYYTALDLPPKGFPTTQWDMYVAEDIGFEKLDILSQRGIGHINECVEIIKENRNIEIDIHQIKKFKKDRKVKKLLRTGETIGCFYVESPAMRGLLKKLRCDNYLSLVAASSIIRPGVAKSGMMREYIKRYHNPKGFKYLHPVMKEQLGETFGVMVYQEDVLKVCHHFAGLDLSDADVLRRMMSGKGRYKKEFQEIKNRFFENCHNRGYSEKITNEVWRQIYSFAGYSFSKAHSASYAVESFQSLYLKAHFPLEFMVAVINNFGGFYRTWVYFNEAKRWGANINLPCINKSNFKTGIIDKEIYIGFIHVKELEKQSAEKILKERKLNGNFKNFDDFIDRVILGSEQLNMLIRIDAFRFSGKSKIELLWLAKLNKKSKKDDLVAGRLFSLARKEFKLPKLQQTKLEDAYDELELLGFSISFSTFNMLETKFRGQITASGMINHLSKQVRMLGNLVSIKYVYTSKKEIMHFGTFLDNTGAFFDTVHFPYSLKNYPFQGNGVYLLLGKLVEEFGHPSLEVIKMTKMPLKPDPRFI